MKLLKSLLDAPQPPKEDTDTGKFCIFHQKWGRVTNDCTCLSHEICELIDNSRMEGVVSYRFREV